MLPSVVASELEHVAADAIRTAPYPPYRHQEKAFERPLLQVIEAQPYGELAKKAKVLRGSIAACDLRADQPDGLRHDAVSYCLQALQLIEGMAQQRFIAPPERLDVAGRGRVQV